MGAPLTPPQRAKRNRRMRQLRQAAASFTVTALIGGLLVGAYLYSQPVRERVDRAVASISDQFASADDADPTGGDRDSTDTPAPPDRPVASKDTPKTAETAEASESEPTADPAPDKPQLAKAEAEAKHAKPVEPEPSDNEPDEATASEADGDDEPATLFGMKIEPGESPDDPQLAEQSEGTGDETDAPDIADNAQPGDGAGDEQLASGQDDEASKPADDEPTRADDGDAQLADAGAGSTGGEPATEQGQGESPDEPKLGPKMPNPPRVTFRTKDGKYVSGRVQAFNDKAFRIQTGPDDHKRLAWSKLPPRAVYQAHAKLLDSSADAWMKFGKRLTTQHGSEKYAKEALRHAAQLDGSLVKPIKKNWPKWQSKAEKLAQQRERAKHAAASPKANGKPVKLVRDFPCAVNHPVQRLGGTGTKDDPAHFKIKFPPGRYEAGFFLFKLENVKGKTVRIDCHTSRAHNWRTLNPVYAHIDPDRRASDALADPELFKSRPPAAVDQKQLPTTLGGTKLPVGKDGFQRWQFMPRSDAKPDKNLFRVEHRFASDKTGSVLVAMKVPYTPGLANSFMQDLRQRREEAVAKGKNPNWKVVQVGESNKGRPLWLVRVGKPTPNTPCIVLYAREHADEHDSSWPVQGALDFLLSNRSTAQQLRQQAVFIIIPLLDPDGAVRSVYEDITRSFHRESATTESRAWGGFFKHWVDSGRRLDLVFNFHNVEAGEAPHLTPAQFEPKKARGRACHTFHRQFLRSRLINERYHVTPRPWGTGWSRKRLAGFLTHYYGALSLHYEVNSQAPKRHLSLYEMRAMGAYLSVAAVRYLHSPKANRLVTNINLRRQHRENLWDYWSPNKRGTYEFPFYTEHRISQKPSPELVSNQ